MTVVRRNLGAGESQGRWSPPGRKPTPSPGQRDRRWPAHEQKSSICDAASMSWNGHVTLFVATKERAEISLCLLKLTGANILVTLSFHEAMGNSFASVL